MRSFAVTLSLLSCAGRDSPPRSPLTLSAPSPSPATTHGPVLRVLTEVKTASTWRHLSTMETTPSAVPGSQTMSDFIGVRLGTFPRVALSILDGEVEIESVSIARELGNRARHTQTIHKTLDATTPIVWLDQQGAGIDTLEIQYKSSPRPTSLQIWGSTSEVVDPSERLPAVLADEMLFAHDIHKKLEIGTKYRTFDTLWLLNDGCIDVRALTITFEGGAHSSVRAPSGRVADQYGNWDGWGVALPSAAQIASIDVDYRIDSSLCDHSELRIIAR